MFNSFDQKNVIVVTSGIGALCLAGSLWYYKTSVWNKTKSLFGFGSGKPNTGNKSGPNGSGPTEKND